MILKRLLLISMVLGSGAFLAACGGGGGSGATFGPAVPVVTSNLAVSADAAVVSTVGTTTVNFPTGFNGVDGAGRPVGVVGATTVAFNGGGASPNFTITNAGSTASGATTFGSCIFTFTTSNFPSTSPFAQGKQFKVDPCTLNVRVAGGAASGDTRDVSESFTFGTAVSDAFFKSVVISRDGTVSLGGTVIGKVTVVTPTGAGS